MTDCGSAPAGISTPTSSPSPWCSPPSTSSVRRDWKRLSHTSPAPRASIQGLAATIGYYNSAETVEGKWFAFIADSSGAIVDHYDKALVGTDLKDLLGFDIPDAPAEGNWVTTEDVRVWVVGYDGLIFGSGWRHDESGS